MAVGRSQVKSYPTPLIRDVLFHELLDLSKEKFSDINYEDPHYDRDNWPHHRVVSIQHVPDRGEEVYAVFYAADRKHQDRYNWEHTKANLGGHKFDTVTRSYLVRRESYNPNTPALGSAMPDVPAGRFLDSAGGMPYDLISRNQDRISERGARAESTIGQAELDSVYVVELRTYIDREEIVSSQYDLSVNGVLFTRQNIYIRGEDYNGSPIETAAGVAANWGPSDAGQLNTVQQVSDDVWVVTTQDLIPQSGLPGDTPLFGGTVVRVYETSVLYSWPAVLGSDGVPEATGPGGVEIMTWTYKEGGARSYARPRYKRDAKRVKSRAVIHQEWLTQTELDDADGSAGSLNTIDELEPDGIYYPSPFYVVNLPPSLHPATGFVADTGTNDPTWGQNNLSTRTYPATAQTDWPASLVVDVDVKPFRGGYMVTRVKVFRPEEGN